MAAQAKITSKGQITIPLKIRDDLGLKPGDSLVFEKEGDTVIVRPAKKINPFAKYRGIEKKGSGLDREEIVGDLRKIRDGEGDV